MDTLIQIAPKPLKVIKTFKNDDGTEVAVVGGDLVVFSSEDSPDLEGDFFNVKSFFGALTLSGSVEVASYYQHGFDDHFKRSALGIATLTIKDATVWAEHQIALRSDYEKHLLGLVDAGKMGQSSGAIAHLVEREAVGKAHWLKSWPIGEASITPTPAEPRTSILPVKSFARSIKASYEDTAWRVQDAWWLQHMEGYVVATYPDHCIVDVYSTYYRIDYVLSGDAVVFADRETWVVVEKEWVTTSEAAEAMKALNNLSNELQIASALSRAARAFSN